MSGPPLPSRPVATGEAGFTLIELLVAMTLSVVVLLAILGASDVFRTTSHAATNLSIAQDTGRTTLRQMTDTLRQATQVPTTTSPVRAVAGRNDLTVAAYVRDRTGASQAGWVRYCSSADGRSLLQGTRIGGPGNDAGACARTSTTDPSVGWAYAGLISGALRDAGTLFAYSSADCFGACSLAPAAIRTIGIRIAVASGDAPSAAPAVLRGAVSLRNRTEAPS